MRLTKDHICEIRSNDEYWFDLNRNTCKDQILSMSNPDIIDLISASFERMYSLDNKKRILAKQKPLKACYMSHEIENQILKVKINWEQI